MDSASVVLIFIAIVAVMVFVRRAFFRSANWIADRIPSGNWVMGGLGAIVICNAWPSFWPLLMIAIAAVVIIWLGHNNPELAKFKHQIEMVMGPISLTVSKAKYLEQHPIADQHKPPDGPQPPPTFMDGGGWVPRA